MELLIFSAVLFVGVTLFILWHGSRFNPNSFKAWQISEDRKMIAIDEATSRVDETKLPYYTKGDCLECEAGTKSRGSCGYYGIDYCYQKKKELKKKNPKVVGCRIIS